MFGVCTLHLLPSDLTFLHLIFFPLSFIGTLSCIVQNNAGDTTTTIQTLDASAIPAGKNNITFTTASPHTIVDNENIALQASFVDDDTDYYLIDYCTTAYDGTASGRAQKDRTATPPWNHVNSQDWIASFSS